MWHRLSENLKGLATYQAKAYFSIRLKGPKSSRSSNIIGLEGGNNTVKEDFFENYYTNTANIYKSNFTEGELQNSNEMVRRVFSLQNASPSEILKYRKAQAVKKYQKHPLDFGSSTVQVASMSQDVILLMQHVKKYRKDFTAARKLVQLLAQRRKMLAYLARTDYHRYKWVCMDYGIPEIAPKNAHHQQNMAYINSHTGY